MSHVKTGFANTSAAEAQLCFRFLTITAFQSWAMVERVLGDDAAAAHFES